MVVLQASAILRGGADLFDGSVRTRLISRPFCQFRTDPGRDCRLAGSPKNGPLHQRGGGRVSREGEKLAPIRAGLLRQTDFAHQFGKPRIRTQRVELEVSVHANEQQIVFLISDVEPMESLLSVSQVGVEAGDDQR